MLKVSDILKEMELRYKNNFKLKFTHQVTYWAAKIHAKVTGNNAFFERYFSVIDNVIYIPVSKTDVMANPLDYESMLRHEYCHLLQSKQESKFKTKYLLTSHYRLLFELEAYCHNLAASRNHRAIWPTAEAIQNVRYNMSYGSIYMMHIPSLPFLNNERIALFDEGIELLVDMCCKTVLDEFTVRYLRDYGRLPSGKFKELEKAVARFLQLV